MGCSVKDNVGHRLAAEVLGRALTQNPPDSVDNIGFSTTIWPDYGAHVAWKIDRCWVNKRFKTSQLDGFETHVPTY